jgi:hypothetical protein
MNKIKLLYDVARTMRGKEKVAGVLTAQVRKDQEEVFSTRTEFGKSATGEASAKVSCELNLDGSRVKRESVTEYSPAGDCRLGGGMFGKLFHHHHGHGAKECCGIKNFFTKISFALGILSSLQAEEQGNSGAVISLNLSDLPEELKKLLLEKMNQKHACHSHCCILTESDVLEALDGVIVLTVNKGREIEILTINLDGRVLNGAGEPQTLAASAEVRFSW